MKKMILLLALIIPLSAQDSTKIKESTGKKVVRTLQDWEWKKFDAAHKRAHMRDMKDKKQYVQRERRAQMSRRNRSKQWIKTLVVGGVAYYIGYKVGQDEMKKGHKGKRPMWMPDREKK
jgi:hypothetical protein